MRLIHWLKKLCRTSYNTTRGWWNELETKYIRDHEHY